MRILQAYSQLKPAAPFPWWGSCRGAAVSVFPLLVIVHALAAAVWTGGHLVLDRGVLPKAIRERSAA